MRSLIFVIAFLCLLVAGCKKNDIETNCQKLKSAITNGNIDQARSAITTFINQLPDQNYTSQNLSLLANKIDSECDINAEVFCFDCIKTLPSQSEIKLSFQSGTSTINKIIDISYTPGNKMKFSNMHD